MSVRTAGNAPPTAASRNTDEGDDVSPQEESTVAAAEPHWSNLQERGTVWGMRFVLVARWLLGRRLCRAVLYPIIGYFYLTDAGRRGHSGQYLTRVHLMKGWPAPTWRDGLAHYMSFAEKMLDSVAAWQDSRRAGPITVVGADLIERRRDSGAGGLLIVSHLGNVELCRSALTKQFGREINVLVHTKNAIRYNDLVARAYRGTPARTIQVTEVGPATAIDLQERIERGEWIAIAGDRTPVTGGVRTSRVGFLGHEASVPQGPYLLASVIGCPIYLLFCLREKGGYRVIFEQFSDRVVLPRRDKEETLTALAARYAQRLEHYCLQAPEQWYNFFDFWA